MMGGMSDKPTPAMMREINATIRYSMWSVFASVTPLEEDRDELADELASFVDTITGEGVTVRGIYQGRSPQGAGQLRDCSLVR